MLDLLEVPSPLIHSSGSLDFLGRVFAHALPPRGHRRRVTAERDVPITAGIARLRHRHEDFDTVACQRVDVVELSEAAIGEVLAWLFAIQLGQRIAHRRHLAHVGADVVD